MCISDIVNTMVGAFLGFVFGFLLELVVESTKRQKSIKNIKIELIDILDTLKKSKDDYTVLNNFYTPIWDTVIGTGDILSYIKKPYYKNLIMVYSHIIYLEELEKSINEEDKDFHRKMDLIIEKRRNVYEELKKLDINSL